MGAEVRKVPSPLPSSTDTVLDPLLVTTRSGRPSRLKSPTAMDVGVAAASARAGRKGPPALPTSAAMRVAPLLVPPRPRPWAPLKTRPPLAHGLSPGATRVAGR